MPGDVRCCLLSVPSTWCVCTRFLQGLNFLEGRPLKFFTFTRYCSADESVYQRAVPLYCCCFWRGGQTSFGSLRSRLSTSIKQQPHISQIQQLLKPVWRALPLAHSEYSQSSHFCTVTSSDCTTSQGHSFVAAAIPIKRISRCCVHARRTINLVAIGMFFDSAHDPIRRHRPSMAHNESDTPQYRQLVSSFRRLNSGELARCGCEVDHPVPLGLWRHAHVQCALGDSVTVEHTRGTLTPLLVSASPAGFTRVLQL